LKNKYIPYVKKAVGQVNGPSIVGGSNRNCFEKALPDMQIIGKRFENIREQSITDRFSIKNYAEAFIKRPNQTKATFKFTIGT